MPTYIVERVMPGATLASVRAVIQAADDACRTSTREGKPIRYLRSTFTPGESRCRCLFEAANADLVKAVNEAAHIPFNRVVIAVELRSASVDGG